MDTALQLQAVLHSERSQRPVFDYDLWLIAASLILLSIGVIMVASTSVAIAERRELDPLYYFWKQVAGALLGIIVAAVFLHIPLATLERFSAVLLFAGIVVAIAVLLPGLGHEVNGSRRWLSLGFITIQTSELSKLAIAVYLAAYLVRHEQQVKTEFLGFIKPIGVLTLVGGLFVLQPDFGAAVVLFTAGLGMLFLGGVPLLRFFSWGVVAVALLSCLAMLAPYRVQRFLTFLDPWADPFNSGFQLTQALIAFGRGEWFGVGLGNSVQKLYYLPEVHTDFVFAVIAEELGLIGSVATILLFAFLVWRIFHLGGSAARAGQLFGAYVTYGIGLLVGLQAFFNMGVNMGLLPTKGLPLPYLSYASNNLVIICAATGIVLRAGYEARHRLQLEPTP